MENYDEKNKIALLMLSVFVRLKKKDRQQQKEERSREEDRRGGGNQTGYIFQVLFLTCLPDQQLLALSCKASIRSGYRKSRPVELIIIRLKIEQNCRLFLDIFSGAIMNYLLMTFTFRLKVDAKCVYRQ